MAPRGRRLLPTVLAILGLIHLVLPPAVGSQGIPGYRLYVSNEYGADLTVIDLETFQVAGTIPISDRPGTVRPRGLGVSPDGTIIYVAVSDFDPHRETQEDKIVAIDVKTNSIAGEYRVGTDPERLAISPDGTQLWAANEDAARATGFSLETGEVLGTFQTGVEPEGVGVSPDGRYVYVTGEASHTVTVIDTRELRTVRHVLVGNRPRDVIFSPDGGRAYVSAEIGGTISVLDTSTHSVIQTIALGLDSRPVEMVLNEDGTRLYVAGGGTSAVYVVDTESYEVIEVVRERMGRRPWGITRVGGLVFTADGLSDSVTIIDAETLSVVGQIGVGRGAHSVEAGVIPGAP